MLRQHISYVKDATPQSRVVTKSSLLSRLLVVVVVVVVVSALPHVSLSRGQHLPGVELRTQSKNTNNGLLHRSPHREVDMYPRSTALSVPERVSNSVLKMKLIRHLTRQSCHAVQSCCGPITSVEPSRTPRPRATLSAMVEIIRWGDSLGRSG